MNEPNEQTQALFAAYVDGELSDEKMAELEARLAEDDALAEAFEAYTGTAEVLSDLPAPHVSDAFEEEVRRRIRKRSRGRFFSRESNAFRQRFQVELLAVAALFILGLIFFLTSSGKITTLMEEDEIPAGGEQQDSDETAPPDDEGDDSSDEDDGEDEAGDEEEPTEPDAALAPVFERRVPRGGISESSGRQMASTTYVDFVYEVRAEMPADELETQLRRRFGRENVEVDGDVLIVWVDRADQPETVERLSEIGEVTRERAEVDPDRARVGIRVHPRQ